MHALVGDGALDYALVLGSFHFINRIADLLHVDPEGVPEGMLRFEPIRRVVVRLLSLGLARMDLRNRAYPHSFDDALAALLPVLRRARAGDDTADDAVAAGLAVLRPRPKMLEVFRLALEERIDRSSLDPATIARVQRTVEEALPRSLAEAEGFHPRPTDPVEAFAFVGTRYAQRTSPEMITTLRDAGWDDLGILDLATAVADANQWARQQRLLDLPAGVLSVEDAGPSASERAAQGTGA